MSKEKQIEQTAREFCHLSAECETCQICDERYHTDGELCYFKLMANEITHHGYRKQKEGEWIMKVYPITSCSVCGVLRSVEYQQGWNYCPNCGARMEGATDED